MFLRFKYWNLIFFFFPLIIAACFPKEGKAYKILSQFHFEQGFWEVAGVKLYNHRMHPIQEELSTFVIKDKDILKKLQQEWEVTPFFEDYCEWHYALKFYCNNKLIKTLKINLYCNYITDGVISYTFKPDFLTKYKLYYKKLPWASVGFTNLQQLRKTIRLLEKKNGVYFYHDLKPYDYDGYFALGVNGLDWGINRDSVVKMVYNKVYAYTGSKDFYVEPYYSFMDNKELICMRFHIYCNQDFAAIYQQKDPNIVASWRSHLDFRDPGEEIELVVIGLTKAELRLYAQIGR
jgi:hypothetical protein